MTAPFFALFLLPEPELFLLFRPSLGRAPGAAEAARSGVCSCSQGWAVVAMDGSCGGLASAAKAAWCGGGHGSTGAAMGGAAWCGP